MSCYSKYGNQPAANILERDGAWHHVAVTWTAANNGLTKVYKDGLLMAEVSALQVLRIVHEANHAVSRRHRPSTYGLFVSQVYSPKLATFVSSGVVFFYR